MTDAFISIANKGGEITHTTYWQSDIERRGLFYLSINAGTLRLLVPRKEDAMIREMQTAHTVVLTRGRYERKEDAVEVLFDDGSDSPFCLWLDPAQLERVWTELDETKPRPFVVYTYPGRKVWETMCHLRHAQQLPYMQPWTPKA